ncbi:MAG: type II toxin-antitoxin system VapC family toxin [Bacteroidota bacterium]
MNYLLDTNIVVIYIRDNEQTRKLQADLKLFSADNNLFLSVVSIGELKSIAKRNQWGDQKLNKLLKFLSEFLIADINIEEVIERYAKIDTYSQGKLEGEVVNFSSRNMGKNDLWIAATASVYNLKLITTGKDFNHLKDEYINLKTINLKDYS